MLSLANILSFPLFFILRVSCTCPTGYSSYVQVVCNLWDVELLNARALRSTAYVLGSQGSFASYHSPPDSRCELFIDNASSGLGFSIRAHSAYIDQNSSVKFYACMSPQTCEMDPAVTWSGVAWNVQQFPDINSKFYWFTINTKLPSLKIVLQVASSPSASNTLSLQWDSGQKCQPCKGLSSDFQDTKFSPHIIFSGCDENELLTYVT